jgi:hypothetical protein
MLTLGRLQVKHPTQHEIWIPVQYWSPIEETHEHLSRVGRSQGLPDPNWLLTSSPTFTYANSNVNPSLCYCFILKTFAEFVSCAYFGWAMNNVRWFVRSVYIHTCICFYILYSHSHIFLFADIRDMWIPVKNFELFYDVCSLRSVGQSFVRGQTAGNGTQRGRERERGKKL